MLPDRVSNPGPLTYESGALPIALLSRHDLRCLYVDVKQQYNNTTSDDVQRIRAITPSAILQNYSLIV